MIRLPRCRAAACDRTFQRLGDHRLIDEAGLEERRGDGRAALDHHARDAVAVEAEQHGLQVEAAGGAGGNAPDAYAGGKGGRHGPDAGEQGDGNPRRTQRQL